MILWKKGCGSGGYWGSCLLWEDSFLEPAEARRASVPETGSSLPWGFRVWSQGTTGTHYPGLAGLAAAMAGIAVVNTTLGEKARIRVWTIVVVILVLDMIRAVLG